MPHPFPHALVERGGWKGGWGAYGKGWGMVLHGFTGQYGPVWARPWTLLRSAARHGPSEGRKPPEKRTFFHMHLYIKTFALIQIQCFELIIIIFAEVPREANASAVKVNSKSAI